MWVSWTISALQTFRVKTGGQQYSDTSPFSIPWVRSLWTIGCFLPDRKIRQCRNHFTEKYLRPPLFPTTLDNRVFKLQVPRFQVRKEDWLAKCRAGEGSICLARTVDETHTWSLSMWWLRRNLFVLWRIVFDVELSFFSQQVIGALMLRLAVSSKSNLGSKWYFLVLFCSEFGIEYVLTLYDPYFCNILFSCTLHFVLRFLFILWEIN